MKEAIQQMVVDYLFNEETKTKLIKAMNENVDIPFIGEATEEKILEAVWESVEGVMKETILKD
tara:strand:- start:210 stop:398 length:189 start_codon:yes stop_codon:yes gene_type:complete